MLSIPMRISRNTKDRIEKMQSLLRSRKSDRREDFVLFKSKIICRAGPAPRGRAKQIGTGTRVE